MDFQPDEILLHILGYIPDEWDHSCIRQVNKRLNRLSKQIVQPNLTVDDRKVAEKNMIITYKQRELTGKFNWNWGLHGACCGSTHDAVDAGTSSLAGSKELAILMIEKGANDWNRGLRGACLRGKKELALLMIEQGAIRCNRCSWNKNGGLEH